MKDRNKGRQRDKDKFERKEGAQRKLIKQRRQQEEFDREADAILQGDLRAWRLGWWG